MGRARLKSRLGFLMLAAGCAVGLGNVWRFPYVVGRNGGAAFVILYLGFLALIGFPLLVAELSIGRGAQRGIAKAVATLAPSRFSRVWSVIGTLVFTGNFLLMIFYTDVAGWLLKYTGGYAAGRHPSDPSAAFASLTGDPALCTAFMLVTVAIATLVCLGGVVKGVERVTKVMMVSLLALLALLAVRALILPGAGAGVEFYLRPDWGRFFEHPVMTAFDAMGQAFFTLSLGIGAMTIFGSYIGRDHSLVKEAFWIIAIDTFVAILAGLVVFPACAAYGVDYSEGPGLIFVALPRVFAKMSGGAVWGFLFFLFLSFAALTTVIAVFECLIGGLADACGKPRWALTLAVGAAVAVASLPCVFIDGALGWEDFAVSQFWLPCGALALTLFVVSRRLGWGWPAFRNEASTGAGAALPDWLKAHYAFVIPSLILVILVVGFYQKFFAS